MRVCLRNVQKHFLLSARASGRHAISDRGHVLDRLPLPNVRPPPHRSRCLPEARHIRRSGRVHRAEPSWVSRGYIACVRIPDGARPNYAGYPDPRLPLRGARRMLRQTVWQIGIQAQIGARASTAPRIASPRSPESVAASRVWTSDVGSVTS